MADNSKPTTAKEAYALGTDYQFLSEELTVGPWTSYSILNDPKHLVFTLARYKFVAKMLAGRGTVLEVGPGDGIGLPIIAQAVDKVIAVDWDQRLIDGNKRRLKDIDNIEHLCVDLNKVTLDAKADAAFSIDVVEHIENKDEDSFMRAMVRCLHKDGVLITGTPNITASQYASPRSEAQHINLKSMDTLKQLTETYCKNVFLFGMNDEVLHTGYAPMCHYIWSIGVGIRDEYLA